MVIHLYRKGDQYAGGETQFVDRVTLFGSPDNLYGKPVLVLNTYPKDIVIPIEEIIWFWVEED